MSFCRPARPPRAAPFLPLRSRTWTKHRADGLTRRRSDLSPPSSSSSSLRRRRRRRHPPSPSRRLSRTTAPRARSLSFLRVLLPRSPLQQPSLRADPFFIPRVPLCTTPRARLSSLIPLIFSGSPPLFAPRVSRAPSPPRVSPLSFSSSSSDLFLSSPLFLSLDLIPLSPARAPSSPLKARRSYPQNDRRRATHPSEEERKRKRAIRLEEAGFARSARNWRNIVIKETTRAEDRTRYERSSIIRRVVFAERAPNEGPQWRSSESAVRIGGVSGVQSQRVRPKSQPLGEG